MQTLSARPPRGEGFGLATMFFTTMGYLVEPGALDQLLRNLRRLVAPGGLVYADVWSGHKMAHAFSVCRESSAENERLIVRRISNVSHVPEANALRVAFNITVTIRETGQAYQFDESHLVRYYTAPEVQNLLLGHGFHPIIMRPLFESCEHIAEAWNFYFIARREVPGER
jgi:hypothetical protein